MTDIKIFNNYFYCDTPIPYKLSEDSFIEITPISILNSEIFLMSIDIFQIDKNSSPSVEIIQMSYLEYILKILLQDEEWGKLYNAKLSVLLKYCLGITEWEMCYNAKNKVILIDTKRNCVINHHQFDDIKNIILYQNFPHYDDTYINPELRKAMQEVDELKNKDIDFPNLERKMAIITAHSGLSKKEQLNMTMRSHTLLFEEVCGEIEFTTVRPVALFGGKSNELEHWIYHKKKDKFNGYITSVEDFNKSMGGNGAVQTIKGNSGDSLLSQFNKIGG